MMFIKSFLIVLLLIPVIFVLWMNLTPGYFQMLGCRFGYYTDEEIIKFDQRLPGNLTATCLPTNFSKFFLYSSKLDFNKGPKVQLDLRGDFTQTTPKREFVPSSDRKTSGIKGTVVGHYCNGTQPVEPPPGYQPCGEEPLASFALKIKNDISGIEKQAVTDDNGKFTNELSPGKYTISRGGDSRAMISGDINIEVKFGMFTEIKLDYVELRQ